MKAILIKTDERKVEEVEFNGTLEHAYELLGCGIIERVRLRAGADIWVDEEAAINDNELGVFRIGGIALIGRGLITGVATDENGEETWGDTLVDVQTARMMVEFYT